MYGQEAMLKIKNVYSLQNYDSIFEKLFSCAGLFTGVLAGTQLLHIHILHLWLKVEYHWSKSHYQVELSLITAIERAVLPRGTMKLILKTPAFTPLYSSLFFKLTYGTHALH